MNHNLAVKCMQAAFYCFEMETQSEALSLSLPIALQASPCGNDAQTLLFKYIKGRGQKRCSRYQLPGLRAPSQPSPGHRGQPRRGSSAQCLLSGPQPGLCGSPASASLLSRPQGGPAQTERCLGITVHRAELSSLPSARSGGC